jgi:MoaA/NifB/PqqE/SkfB family radical SAM enzyme
LGEPLLNKTIVAMIEYAHSLNVGVTISTNLAMKLSEETLQGLVKSGLDKLMVSLDGATSETYRQYRVGGNFELVRENVKRLAAIKDQLGSRTPEIQWKFIEFEHNRSEVSVVPSLYRKWGFDSYRIDFDRKDTRVEDVARSRYARKESCFWLYSTIAVDVDGTVQPCCSFRLSTDWHLGDALVSDIRLLWNSPAYQSLRKGFGRVNYGGSMHPTCRLCFSGEPRRPEALASTP